MRHLTLLQDMDMDVAEHWRLFLDDAFDRDLYLQGLGFSGYELLESRQTETEVIRRIRVVPKLDVPGPVRKALGSSFAYTEEGRFDKKEQVWHSKMIPSVLADRLTCVSVVRASDTTAGRCRRTVDSTLDARVFGIGGMLESALEKSVRSGWEKSAAYMNRRGRVS